MVGLLNEKPEKIRWLHQETKMCMFLYVPLLSSSCLLSVKAKPRKYIMVAKIEVHSLHEVPAFQVTTNSYTI
jgi:hypothetical protein